MFQAFLITLREGIEAALVVGLLVSYIRKTGRVSLEKPVFLGVAAAVLLSIAGAVVFSRVSYNEEAYEGVVYCVSAVFVASMMVWMKKTARSIRGDVERRVDAASAGQAGFSAAVGLAIFSFLMIFREGVETILFLGAATMTTDGLLACLGALGGVVLAVLFAVAFVRGSIRIDIGRFFRVTGVVLGIFLVQLLVNGYHELAEAGVLPASRVEMALVGPVVRNNVLFVMAILLIPAIAGLSRSSRPVAIEIPPGPERRLLLAERRRERTWRVSLVTISFVTIALFGFDYVSARGTLELSPARLVEIRGDVVRIPLSEASEAGLHRYGIRGAGRTVVRFLLRPDSSPDSKRVSAAFDACEICGDFGYAESEGHLVCLNCAAEINPLSFGQSGGCNPIPLPSSIEGDAVVIRAADLLARQDIFGRDTDVIETDPVCLMGIRVGDETESIERSGRTYYFCNPDCAARFRTDPESYAH